MKISDKHLDEFIALYKREYGEELERNEALGQVQALVWLVKGMLPLEDKETK